MYIPFGSAPNPYLPLTQEYLLLSIHKNPSLALANVSLTSNSKSYFKGVEFDRFILDSVLVVAILEFVTFWSFTVFF